MKKEIKCDHFWEIDLSTLKDDVPTFICMFCGKKKKDMIPVLNLNEITKNIN
jgi:hypothetical protein